MSLGIEAPWRIRARATRRSARPAMIQGTAAVMTGTCAMSEPTAPLIGRPAPDFQVDTTCGPGQAPRMRRLEDYRGRWLVLLFYPRDFSMICPTELSALSRRRSELEALGAEVLAVSTDTIETHCRWLGMSADAGGVGPLTFPLGSDPRGAMSRAYQVCMEPLGLALRGLFVIDPNSIIR